MVATQSAVAPAPSCAPATSIAPWPVAVRLDDGPEADTVERTQQRSHVAPQRAEVDRVISERCISRAPNGRDSMTSGGDQADLVGGKRAAAVP